MLCTKLILALCMPCLTSFIYMTQNSGLDIVTDIYFHRCLAHTVIVVNGNNAKNIVQLHNDNTSG